MSVHDLMSIIKKKAKGTHISILTDSEIAKTGDWIFVPSYDLNRILSGSIFKTLPSKSFTTIVGPEASGKSSFMCLSIAAAQQNGYTVVIIDTEGMNLDFYKRWGINTDDVIYIYCPWIDNIKVVFAQLIESDQQHLAVMVDSIGTIEKYKIQEDALAGDPKGDQGGLQKELKVLFKMMLYLAKYKNSIVMASGHYYGSPGKYGNSDEIGGGKALRYTSDIILSLRKTKLVDQNDKSNIIGTQINAVTLKNRLYTPFNEGLIEINYEKGLNSFAGLVDLGKKANIIDQAGAWFSYKNEKFQGSLNLERALLNNKTFLDEIELWISKHGYSSINQEVKFDEELNDKKNSKNEEKCAIEEKNDTIKDNEDGKRSLFNK